MLNKATILSIVLLTLLISQAETRKYSNSINLFTFRREGSFAFIDRIHLDPGNMHISAQLRLNLNHIKAGAAYTLHIAAVPDPIWPKSL